MPIPSKSRYDLAVAYRIYPTLAKTAATLPFLDKKTLAETCVKSFSAALGKLRAKVWVLLDGCPFSYEDLFRKHLANSDLIFLQCGRIGNRATFAKQLEILLNQDDAELVYFAEDDYFYLSNALPKLLAFLRGNPDCDFVTPYDHPDCYNLDLHRQPKWLKLFDGRHWRSAASTCLTFLTTQTTLRRTRAVFQTYSEGNADASLWLSLTKSPALLPQSWLRFRRSDDWLARIVEKSWWYTWRQIVFGQRYKLWTPVPGLATHLDATALSPAVDWPALFRSSLNSLQREARLSSPEALAPAER
jgi:hypothetical protein